VPEGDTVWRTARHLDQALSGQALTQTDFRVPDLATVDLAGQQVERTFSRGKHLLTRIGAEHTLHTHLKMEGSWHLYRPRSPWRRPAHEARVVLRTDEWTAVGFALGIVAVLPRVDEDLAVGHLGPDLLGPDWDEDEALRRLRADEQVAIADALLDQTKLAGSGPRLSTGDVPPTQVGGGQRAIGEALLDQRCLAGLGTVYRAETLFLAGVSPYLTVSQVPDLAKVVRLARRLLKANLERARPVTTGVARKGQELWVYGRAGRPCRRCGTTIKSAMQGPPQRERVVYWCPSCQP
jgi:endonuclease-8